MNCSLDDKKFDAIFKATIIRLGSLIGEGDVFDVDKIMREAHTSILEKTKDPILALNVLMAMPKILLKAQMDSPIVRQFTSHQYQKIVDYETKFADSKLAEQFISPIPQELEAIQNAEKTLEDLIIMGTLQQDLTPIPPSQDLEIARPLSAFTDTGQEALGKTKDEIAKNIPNPARAIYYSVKRMLIKRLLSHEGNSSTIQIAGVKKGGVYLTAMASNKIPFEQLYDSTKKFLTEEGKTEERKAIHQQEGVVLALTDIDGNFIYFDKTNNVTSPAKGKIMYYFMRSPYKSGHNKYALDKADTQSPVELAKSLSKRLGREVSEEEAVVLQQRQLETLYKIAEYINKDRKNRTIRNIITGGTLGYLKKSENTRTPLNTVKLTDVDKTASFRMQKTSGAPLWKGAVYFKSKGIDELISIEPTVFSPNQIENLVNLMTEDVFKMVSGEPVKLSDTDKFNILNKFIMNTTRINFEPNKDQQLEVILDNKALDLKSEQAKEILTRFFNDFGYLEVRDKDLRPNQMINAIDVRNPDYKTLVYHGAIVKKTDEKGKVIYKKAVKLTLKIDEDSLLDPSSFKDFSITKGLEGKMILTEEAVPYYKIDPVTSQLSGFMPDHTFTKYAINAEGNLVKLNAHFEFQPVLSDLEKIVEKPKQETKKEPKKGPTQSIANQKLLDRLKGLGIKRSKLTGQKLINRAATAEQIEAAEKWWANHPLKNQFSLKVMFNVINTAQPDEIASWQMNSITLWAGADMTDLYHEAWHGFTQAFLTPEDKENLYKETGKRSGSFTNFQGNLVSFHSASPLELEEFLAEEFREFVLAGGKKISPNTPVKTSIFRKIWNFLREIFGGTSISDIAANDKAVSMIQDLYDKLYVGNIGEYTFKEENAFFDTLPKGIESTKKEGAIFPSLSYEDSAVIVDSVDSLLSTYIDFHNSGLLPEDTFELLDLEAKKSLGEYLSPEEFARMDTLQAQANPIFTSTLLSTPQGRSEAYDWVKTSFIDQRTRFEDRLAGETDELQIQILTKRLELLNFVINNFGDISQPRGTKDGLGVINYHNKMSKYLAFQDKYFVEDEIQDDPTSKDSIGDRKGNEHALEEMASNETLFLVKSLHAVNNETKEIEFNKLGIRNLAEFPITWNRLAKVLEGSMSLQEMERRLRREISMFPIFGQLLKKLGSSDSLDPNIKRMWLSFYRDFNVAKISLSQLTFNKIAEGSTFKYYSTAGENSASHKAIGLAWRNAFRLQTSKYIQKNPATNANYLDVEQLLKDFPNPNNNKLAFLRAMGVLLDVDNEGIDEELRSFPLHYVVDIIKYHKYKQRDELEKLKKKKTYIDASEKEQKKMELVIKSEVQDLNQIFISKYDPATFLDPKKPDPKHPVFIFNGGSNQSGRFTTLQKMQSRYSSQFTNFTVSNAAGNMQYEHSLKSTMVMMIEAINSVASYAELMQIPHMTYLDITKNPFSAKSIWLNSIFDFQNGGIKRKYSLTEGQGDVKITMENLSGLAMLIEGEEAEKGSTTSDADEFAKAVLDFHMLHLRGTPENMKHSDKGSAFSTRVSRLVSPGTKTGSQYIDTGMIIADPKEANNALVQIMTDYIGSEHKRVRFMRDSNSDSEIANVKDYYERGKYFVMFNDVLSVSTRKALYKIKGDLETYLNSGTDAARTLQEKIREDVLDYFDKITTENSEIFAKANFVADDFVLNIKKDASKAYKKAVDETNAAAVIQGSIRAFTLNSWIHNMETIIMFYGDVALYNQAKEEFHKRNAALAATGVFHAYDQSTIDYVNTVLEGSYANEIGIAATPFSQILKSAVLDDTNSISAYKKEYIQSTEKVELARLRAQDKYKKGSKKEQARLEKITIERVTKSMKAYGFEENGKVEGMKTGDAQGWITLDAYRQLRFTRSEWTPKQEELYQKILKGEYVSVEDTTKFFPVEKLQYSGYLANDLGIPVMGLHKFSVFPLNPAVIGDSRFADRPQTNLMKLHEAMMKQGIHYALFKSGSKVSTITNKGKADQFYSNYDTQEFNEGIQFTPNKIYLAYLKNQLRTAPEYKGKASFSTQLRKLIELGLMEGGVPTDFRMDLKLDARRTAWEALKDDEAKQKESPKYTLLLAYEAHVRELTELKKEELKDEVGFFNGKGSLKRLVELVKEELSKQEIAEHELDFIQELDNKLINDLSLSFSAEKIERLLTALVNKRLIKIKVNGESLVQVSGAGFESLESTKNRNYRNPTKEELDLWGTNDLPTYRRDPKTGKTLPAKVKIALQGKFIKLLQLPEVIEMAKTQKIERIDALNILIKTEEWLNKDENRRMVTMVGVRIPVQGINSMEFMEVYQFLPSIAGNIIIPPADIVAKSGSDYDIDKLTVYMPNLTIVNKKVKLYKTQDKLKSKDVLLAEAEVVKTKIDKEVLEHKKKVTDIKGKARDLFTPEDNKKFEDLEKTFTEDMARAKAEEAIALVPYRQLLTKKGSFTPAQADQVKKQLSDIHAHKANLIADYAKTEREYFQVMKTTLFDEENSRFQEAMIPLREESEEITDQLNATKAAALENEILWDMKKILELEDNFVKLIRPNDTDIVKEVLTDEFTANVQDYDSKKRYTELDIEEGDKAGVISGTRILEYRYNLDKHVKNSIGKQSLGIGAVDNSYNSILNRIGAYLEPTYTEGKGTRATTREQKIFLKHNNLIVNGQKVISLSHTYDANEENDISDIISQLINGWVDIAKDTWVFNVQGNKEVTPVLLFMIQAGIPYKQAVYLASQPLVREYVEEQRFGKSTIADPLGKHPGNRNYFRSEARKTIMRKYGIFTEKQLEYSPPIYAKVEELITKYGEEAFEEGVLLKNIKKENIDEQDMLTFLHFLQLEDMSKVVTGLKMATNFDTKTSPSLFEAKHKLDLLDQLEENDRLSPVIVSKIFAESPIGSFKIQQFMVDLWEPLFKFREKDVINDFLIKKMKAKNFSEITKNRFNKPEDLISSFKNDLISFIFQNTVKAFNLDAIKEYKGLDVEESIPVADVQSLRFGAWVKTINNQKVLLVDKNQLKNDYKNGTYLTTAGVNTLESSLEYSFKKKVALINPSAFSTSKEYYKFIFERENLRSIYTPEKVKKNYYYQKAITNLTLLYKKPEGVSAEEHMQQIRIIAYEHFLRDRTLDNIFNSWKMFESSESYAQQFMDFQLKFPHLEKEFLIFRIMGMSQQRKGSLQNLFSKDGQLTSDKLNILHANLEKLANLTAEDIPDEYDREMLNNFFGRFPFYAFMQSGLNSKGLYSLGRMAPTDKFAKIMTGPVATYSQHMNPIILERFWQAFLIQNGSEYRTSRFRHKNYTIKESLAELMKLTLGQVERLGVEETEVLPAREAAAKIFSVNPITGSVTYNLSVIDYKASKIKELMAENPDMFFVYNDVISGAKKFDIKDTDAAISDIDNPTNHIGIPTRLKLASSGNWASINSIKDTTLEENKIMIDVAIQEMVKLQQAGKTLVFNSVGYGQGMIGNDPKTGMPIKDAASVAKQTFLYLSQQLFEKFGYVNPGMLNTVEGLSIIQKNQPVSDEEVMEAIKMCQNLL